MVQKIILILVSLFYSTAYSQFKVKELKSITYTKALKAPRFSPNGVYVLASSEGNKGLYIFSVKTKKLVLAYEEELPIGYFANWDIDSKHVLYKRDQQVIRLNINSKTEEVISTPLPATLVHQFQAWDAPLLTLDKTLHLQLWNNNRLVNTSKLEQVYHPVLSPNQKWIIAHSGANMYLMNLNLEVIEELPWGLANTFNTTSDVILFHRDFNEACGHLERSELWSYHLSNKTLYPIILPSNYIPLFPDIYGNQICFENEADGTLVLGTLY